MLTQPDNRLSMPGNMITISNGLKPIDPMHGVKFALPSYKKEDDTYFYHYILLPGLTKENIKVEQIIEKDFITHKVTIKEKAMEEFIWLKSFLNNIKIIKVLNNVDTTQVTDVGMHNGLLLIKITKKYPIKRKELEF